MPAHGRRVHREPARGRLLPRRRGSVLWAARLVGALGALGALGAILTLTAPLGAEEVAVPVAVQANLIAKVSAYDRNFAQRAGSLVVTLVIVHPDDSESERNAAQLRKELGRLDTIVGLPHAEQSVTFTSGSQLGKLVKARSASIVYVTTGFTRAELRSIGDALAGLSVLSVGALPGYVPNGVVLGFDLVSGKPKMLIDLTQAKRQSVAFSSEALKLMKVFE